MSNYFKRQYYATVDGVMGLEENKYQSIQRALADSKEKLFGGQVKDVGGVLSFRVGLFYKKYLISLENSKVKYITSLTYIKDKRMEIR